MLTELVATAILIFLPLPPSSTAQMTGTTPLSETTSSTSLRSLAATNEARAASTVPQSYRRWAACVVDRESGGTLERQQSGVGALNAGGYQGRWQFGQDWNHGGPYMVRDRLVQFGMAPGLARKVRVFLSGRPIHRWPGIYQDVLFNEAVERGGSHHWSLPGSRCEGSRP